MQELFSYQQSVLNTVGNKFYRFLYPQIDWDLRMIGIKGPRGTGKTTLMLQRIKYGLPKSANVLYMTIEHPWFFTHSLFDTVSDFYKNGGEYVFIDEVHKYERWSRELKVIYDGFPTLKIVFSASSALQIFEGESDLSRRVITYELPGLSFREYLEFSHDVKFEVIQLEDIITKQAQINPASYTEKHLLPLFRDYLKSGYLPVTANLKPELVQITLQNIINTTINNDIQPIANFPPQSVNKLKRVLGMIAEITPYEPNISSVANKLVLSRNSVLHFIHLLEKAKILSFITKDPYGISKLQKPNKIYLENSNLNYALTFEPNMGTLRETFFLNQLRSAGHEVTLPPRYDFLVDNNHIIEVGGKSKKVPGNEVFIAMDDIEAGFGNTIPLWMFGLLY